MFEGPLQGLVDVARREDDVLSQVSLCKLIDGFLAELPDPLNGQLDGASEYLLLFSELIRIKTRSLLPGVPDEPDEIDDVDYQQPDFFQLAARRLQIRAEQRARLYDTNPDLPDVVADGFTEYKEVTLFELLQAFQKIRVTHQERSFPRIDITNEWDTAEQMDRIMGMLSERQGIPFRQLLSARPTREEVIVTFLSLLQLVKQGRLRLLRKSSSDPIVTVSVRQNGRRRHA